MDKQSLLQKLNRIGEQVCALQGYTFLGVEEAGNAYMDSYPMIRVGFSQGETARVSYSWAGIERRSARALAMTLLSDILIYHRWFALQQVQCMEWMQ